MRKLFSRIGLAAIVSVVGTRAHAQSRTAGLMVTAGGGWGSAGVTCDDCGSGRESAPALMARVGGTLNAYLGFAAQLDYLRKTQGSVDLTTRYVTFSALVYPSPASGFYLVGHVGQGMRSASTTVNNGTAAIEATGLAIGGGIGYEIPLSSAVSLSPYFTAMTNLTEPPRVSIKPNILQIGAALTWHGR